MPRPLHPICTNCERKFVEYRSAEEKLLDAIFGQTLCAACRSGEFESVCARCGGTVVKPVFYDDQPYHSACAAKLFGL